MERNNEISVPPALLMAALRSTNDGVVIADAKISDQPLIYVNPAFSAITGYSYEETIGNNCRFLQGEDRNQPELSVLREALGAPPCLLQATRPTSNSASAIFFIHISFVN